MRIRIVAASSPAAPDRLARGVAFLQGRGHLVLEEGPRSLGSLSYVNGSDEERCFALTSALADDVDVVWLARGGYGLGRLLPMLAATTFSTFPRVVGFSDATALFAWMQVRGLLHRAIHGPLATTLPDETPESVAHLDRVIAGEGVALAGLSAVTGSWGSGAKPGISDTILGPVFAGNLSVLASVCGTAAMPQLGGHIVVLEDVGERPYRIDRMLTQLIQSGAFAGAVAVVVGHLTRCEEPVTEKNHQTATSALAVFEERIGSCGIPLFVGARVGHETPNFALPLGGMAEIVTDAQGYALVVRSQL